MAMENRTPIAWAGKGSIRRVIAPITIVVGIGLNAAWVFLLGTELITAVKSLI